MNQERLIIMNNGDAVTIGKLEPMMTVREVTRLLHVHPNTLRRWSDSGIIKSYRITPRGDRRFKKDDIQKYLSELESEKCNPKQVQVTWR